MKVTTFGAPLTGPSKHHDGTPASFPIVAIGASAGGLEALTQLVEQLSHDSGMAYVIVQHLDPKHKSMLTELLSRHTSISIEEVRRRTKIEKDRIYVIPPNRNMSLVRGELILSARGTSASREMPIDILFRSVALECPGNCVGVVLSGTGTDGSMGINEIKSAGGITFAQDQDTALHDGMPRAAVATGAVDYILPPASIALELRRIAVHPYTHGKQIAEMSREAFLQRIFAMLRVRTSVDFRHYKQSTIKRRIFRRMALLKIDNVDEYVRLLSRNQEEVDALYQDMLIKVTCFFREPQSFRFLQEHVFPTLTKGRSRKEPIRIWVPGCSSGEEVYSLAMALLESLDRKAGTIPIQIFGTDVSATAVEKARSGLYIQNIALDVSPGRLRRWFAKVDLGYQISKEIREMCIFAKQNVTSDPPFSKLDLISCRNLLIYLDTVLQARVMPIFHYALKESGFLMLGSSESVGSNHLDLFSLVDKRSKIYTKKRLGRVAAVSFTRPIEEHVPEGRTSMPDQQKLPDIQQEADRFIVSHFAPVGVIVDENYKIIQFRGATGEYLEPASGAATFHLLKMARGNLGLELRSLVQRAKSSERPVRKEKFRYQPKRGLVREIGIGVAPIRSGASSPYHFLVLFEEGTESPAATTEALPSTPEEKREGPELELDELRRELSAVRTNLQSTIEESEATNEELKSANEEIMSSNEELQSTNEELETAKEELQSTNEELTTVNEEIQTRNNELSVLNNDLHNFVVNVNVPVIMLGTDLKIRRYTPAAQRFFHLIPSDVGRSFGDIKPKVDVPNLERLITRVVDSLALHEQEIRDDEGRYYQLVIRPYRTPEKVIDGAVLVFNDIDLIKRASLQLEESRAYADAILEAVFDPVLVLDSDFIVQRANPAFYRLFRADVRQTENRSLFLQERGQWNSPEIRRLLHKAVKPMKKAGPPESADHFYQVGRRSLVLNARSMPRKSGQKPFIVLTIVDISTRIKAEQEKAALAAALGKERALFEAVLRQMGMGVAIFEAADGKLLLANEGLRHILGVKPPASASLASFRKLRPTHPTAGRYRESDWPITRSLHKGEIILGEELVLDRSTGERSVIQLSSSPVFAESGKMIAIVALFQDMTERTRIKEQIVRISSREQQRIAHDLHDGLGQELAAMIYRVKALKSRLGPHRRADADEAGKIGHLAARSLARIRDLVKFLQPVAMDSKGLMNSLGDLAETSARLYHIDCTFVCPRPVTIPNQDVALHVYRIAQEAVHNAIKHGKPKLIKIELRKSRKETELAITNNGTSFKPTRDSRKRGLGLHIMRYRANMINGKITVKARIPRGTEVRCLFEA